MRTLFSPSRAFGAAAAIVAAALILGGAFFAGYVGETSRDASTLRHRAAAEVATVERALGYGGFLKAYRSYRLTGDAEARPQLSIKAAEAAHAIERLRALYAGDAAAGDALSEAAAVTDAFAHVARIAPQLGDAALRGTAEMKALNGLPQSQQLETTYLSLRGAFDRLSQAGLEDRLGGAAAALSSSQTLIIAGIAFLALALIAVAGLLNWGVVRPLKTLAHKADAAKDELQVKFEGAASLALEKLASDVAAATDALNVASADLIRLQGDGRRHFDAAVRNLTQTRAGLDEAAKIANENAAAAIDDLRASTAKLTHAADERAQRLDEITARFDHGGRTLEQAFTAAKEKADVAAGGLASSSVSLNRLAEDARTLCHKVSSDSAAATGKVHTLASQLAEAVDAVDERMGQKLNALDSLEQHLSVTLAKVEERADETLTALNTAAVERGAGAEAQLRKTAAAFEQVLCEVRGSAEPFAKLNSPVQSPAAAPEFDALAKALHAESETIRNEIRNLAVRLTEDRLLAGADMPFLSAKAHDAAPRKTLADVPGDEITARLKNLAAEMSAAQVEPGDAAALQRALSAFATEVKELAPQADRATRLKTMGKALDRHAGEIEARSAAIDPAAGALRGEVQAITSELRTLAARAHSAHVKNAPALREAATNLGERAEALFARFDRPVADETDEAIPEPMNAATTDLAALALLVGRLETRAEHLARTALAARFTPAGPGEHGENLKTESAIHTVFESIERLNNIAAALARAGDAERLRRAAH